MRFSEKMLLFCLPFFLALSSFAKKPKSASMLPKVFAGWEMVNPQQTSKSPESADPANASLLKEYGFTDFEGATYTRDDGRKLTIKAARFQDASGAYGAFTFYKMPQMPTEEIGDMGASLNERVLFYRGNILVDAVFQRVTAMSAAELRELADDLPRPAGNTANLPGLLTYLPKRSYVKNSTRYVMGPVGMDAISAPLPARLVDFSRGAEVVLGEYDLSGRQAKLMLIGYPTPQIAIEQLKQIQSAQQAHQLGDLLAIKRTGPMLVLASGNASEGDAKSLLAAVNYDADITWNQKTFSSLRDNPANLIVGVILLAGVICGLAIIAGIAFGGFRVLTKRLLPGKVFDRPEQIEIIALHLSDRNENASNAGVSSSINTG